jgi:hypothetical protein
MKTLGIPADYFPQEISMIIRWTQNSYKLCYLYNQFCDNFWDNIFFPFIFWNKNNKERGEEREAKHNESMWEKVVSKIVQK